MGAIFSVVMAGVNVVTAGMGNAISATAMKTIQRLQALATGAFNGARSIMSGDSILGALQILGGFASAVTPGLKSLLDKCSPAIQRVMVSIIGSLQKAPELIYKSVKSIQKGDWFAAIANIFNAVLAIGKSFAGNFNKAVEGILKTVDKVGNTALYLGNAIKDGGIEGWLSGIDGILGIWKDDLTNWVKDIKENDKRDFVETNNNQSDSDNSEQIKNERIRRELEDKIGVKMKSATLLKYPAWADFPSVEDLIVETEDGQKYTYTKDNQGNFNRNPDIFGVDYKFLTANVGEGIGQPSNKMPDTLTEEDIYPSNLVLKGQIYLDTSSVFNGNASQESQASQLILKDGLIDDITLNNLTNVLKGMGIGSVLSDAALKLKFPLVPSEVVNSNLLFRRMSMDEAIKSLNFQELQPAIKGAESFRWMSTSLEKSMNFINNGYELGKNPTLAFVVDDKTFSSLNSNAIPQKDSAGKLNIKYHYEPIYKGKTLPEGDVNYGIYGKNSQTEILKEFNKGVQYVGEATTTKPWLTTMQYMGKLQVVGKKVLMPVGVLLDGATLWDAYSKDGNKFGQQFFKQSLSVIGSNTGGILGGVVGSSIGLFTGPAALITTPTLGITFGIVGSQIGSNLGSWIGDKFYPSKQEKP